jgi:hypothetical protein
MKRLARYQERHAVVQRQIKRRFFLYTLRETFAGRLWRW